MNPFPVVGSLFARNRLTLGLFVLLIAFSVALGIVITAQERAVRQGSARAADRFDLVVGAPGSPFDLVLATVYARPAAVELLPPAELVRLMAEPSAAMVAPIAFGDTVGGFPVMGTTAAFVEHLSGAIAEGRAFARATEAVLGANVPLAVGDGVRPAHETFEAEEDHHHDLLVVGRMARTDTAWDNVVVVPIEQAWLSHGLPPGHAVAPGEDPDEIRIGPPFDPDQLTGVPAVVVKPSTLAAAYGLRNAYRTSTTQALFPAEVLVQLYALLGDARAIMGYLATATQILVVASIIAGVIIILQLFRTRFAVLRALGAGRGYVFAVAWTYVTLLIVAGSVLGLCLGAAGAWAVSAWLEARSGIAMPVTIAAAEFRLVLILVAAGALLAALPAIAIYRQPVVEGLR